MINTMAKQVRACVDEQAASRRRSDNFASQPVLWWKLCHNKPASHATKQAKLEKNLAHATPLPSSGLASDIAYAALYLASDEGRYVNSHDLVVDGGRTAMFNESA